MKIKLITTAIAAALYSAGSLHAAAGFAVKHQLQAPNIDVQQIKQYSDQVHQNSQSMAENDGLNVQIRRQENKFTAEDGLTGEHVYIVRLLKPALATKQFGEQTLQKIRSNDNKLFNAGKAVSADINSYKQELLQAQQATINSLRTVLGNAKVRRQFTNAVNGFSMTMTQEQAALVAQSPDVLSVQRSKIYDLHTDAGPELIKADTVWTGSAEATAGVPYKGEGVIVGIIDTGINSDHPSFAATGADGYSHTNPWGAGTYVGDCLKDGFEDLCNDKLIGIRSYPVITDLFTSGELGAVVPAVGEDYQGHGSHVASTAAGNVLNNIDFTIPAAGQANDGMLIKENFFPQISGVAPHANIISYQVCYPSDEDVAGCPGEALVAGIEDAIADGVDVINFSIGGQDSHPWTDTVEMAFLAAREAGIVVAAAAGNSGQAGGTSEYFGAIDHASPWLLNVAATTHGRQAKIDTVISDLHYADPALTGNRQPTWSSLSGGALTDTAVTGVVLRAADYLNVNNAKDQYCGSAYAPGTFDFYPDGSPLVDANNNPLNAIVVCARDSLSNTAGVARALKSDNIKAGGADGFIMYNYSTNDPIVYTASYSLPAVHLSYGDWFGQVSNGNYGLEDWTRSNNGKSQSVTINPTVVSREVNAEDADWLAPFSSRGPSPSTPEALIPAVAAPGVDIYAAYADEHPFAASAASGDFSFLSGTSMASPHVAGAAALLRQVHPDWTATEIQSALAMTADNVVQYRRLNQETGDIGHASTYRAGTGRINVENAINAGLVMDETADNFRAADPKNGGVVHKLNLPQLVNFSCKPTCTWIRKVTATKDGSWSVSNDNVYNWAFDMRTQYKQNGVSIDVQPSEFTLAAGESQTLVITAAVMDTQDIFSNAEVELHSNLILTETSGASPEAHWPMVFKYDMNNMPSKLEAVAHRNSGNTVFKGIELPATDTPVVRTFKPVKADVRVVTLPKDDDGYFPWSSGMDLSIDTELRLDEATVTEWVTVPEGAKRLVVESQGTLESALKGTSFDVGNLIVYVGKDYNGNGLPDMNDELVCMSSHIMYNNFCNVNNPEGGDYWVVVYNTRQGSAQNNYYNAMEETFSYSIAVVEDELSTDITAEVPATDGTAPVDLTLNWDMADMAEGDIYYSVVDFGTSAVNAGNIGKVALKLTRGVSDVHLDVPNTGAKKGDYVPYTFEVLANNTGADRAFTITANMPQGLNVSAANIFTSNDDIVTDIKVENGQIVISGTQPDTRDVAPAYNITSNLEDVMCRTPDFGNKNPGGYVNLNEFGFQPSLSGFADKVLGSNGRAVSGKDGSINTRNGYVLPIKSLFNGSYDSFHLYNNTDKLNAGAQNVLEIRGNGVMSLWEGQPFFFPYHLKFPYLSFPYESIAPLWRGYSQGANISYDVMSVPLDTTGSDRSGITLASTATGWGIIEFDNARSYGNPVQDAQRFVSYTERDDRFDFEVIFNVNTQFGKGEYEMFYAYDNIDFASQGGRGSIGLQGFRGAVFTHGPLQGYLGNSVAFDDLDEKLTSGLVYCFDYVGPESSQFEVTVWAEVGAKAAGSDITFTAVSQVEGMEDISMNHTLKIPGNITLGEIADQTVDENSTLDGIMVMFVDEENSANQITVTGANIKSTVSGHESGSTISITPVKDFHGNVEVTVTVADIENPADSTSTSFMLTVVSDGKEPVVVTPPPVTTPAAKKSSGSFGFLMLSLFGLLACRRQR